MPVLADLRDKNILWAMPELIDGIPRGESYLVLQLKRALTSAILNLSEGNGRYSIKERNRFFNISLGSISEVMAAIDIILAFGYANISFSHILDKLSKAYNMIRKLKK